MPKASETITPASALIEWWEGISTPYKYPARSVEGLGTAVLSRTVSSCHVSICSIWAVEERKGLGTQLMRRITGKADELGVFLEVVPLTYKPWLTKWYEKHGFTETALDDIALLRIPKFKEISDEEV